MRKLFLFAAATLFAANLFAVPAPTNVHWDGSTLKWDLPELTDDSVYTGVNISLYSEDGTSLSGMGGGIRTEYSFASYIYHGRTYYAIIHTHADISDAATNPVSSPTIQSPNYTDPNPKDTLEVPNVTLTIDGEVSWGSIGYTYVRATLQKQNGSEWDDVTSAKTGSGWNTSISLGAITTPGTYRAIADGLQGEDVVRRGISPELVVEEMFTVSFDAQSLFTNPDDAIVAKNALISAPTIPAEFKNRNDGHIFYWSTDAAGNNPWTFSTNQITQDTTLYAQWTELPALNPVWDEDTCKWTFTTDLYTIIYSRTVLILTENHNLVSGIGGGGANSSKYYGDYYFPGRKYAFAVILTDFYDNYVSDTSALRTFPGEAATLPLENMTMANASNARVEWDAAKYGVYIRHGELYQWNKGTSDWDELETYVDMSAKWNYMSNFLVFNQALDADEYYKIHCTLNQGEYVIYEGELFYGTNPSTGIDNVSSSSLQGGDRGRLILRDGQVFILRGDKTYTITGQEVK